MSIVSLQVFATSDGKQFTNRDEAVAHQVSLDNAQGIANVAESFVNTTTASGAKVVGMVGRTRAFNLNVASQVMSFLLAHGIVTTEDLEAFEKIEPSEELAVRLAEAEAAAAAAPKKGAKAEVVAEEQEPVAEADLFA